MNKEAYIQLLEHPEQISSVNTQDLKGILDVFPYCQSAHALHLKGLKNERSFAYNKALKVTAAHTGDRGVLFDFITSAIFEQNELSEAIKSQSVRLQNIEVVDASNLSQQVAEEELEKATKILDPELFVLKEDSEMTKAYHTLEVGTPLVFEKNETHSFSEWLKLSSTKPIDRTPTNDEEPLTEVAAFQEVPHDESPSNPIAALVIDNDKPERNASLTQDTVDVEDGQETLSRKRKQEIIDSFIKANPKIARNDLQESKPKVDLESRLPTQESLMTETLARIYVEQKNYKKAKQAYRILSLKYPEKSGFFADQIRAVEHIEANN